MMTELISALPVIVSLIILEGLLSVDNAMVIAAMVSHLPGKQKVWALRAGLAGAYIFRGLTLFFISFIIANPWIKLAGAGYLVYLMCKHLALNEEKKKVNASEAVSQSFWGTVIGVELADLAFSIDNVIAAVALSPKFWVVVLGVFIGILAMRFVAGFFVNLMEKYPVLEPVAYVLVGYVGLQLFAEEFLNIHVGEYAKLGVIAGVITTGLLYSKLPWLQTLLNPIFRLLQYVMGLVARIVNFAFFPVTWLCRRIFSLFEKKKS